VGGLLGVGALLTSSIRKAETFTKASAEMASALKLPIGAASALVDTMDDFGISADRQVALFGKLSKNAEMLAGTTKKAAAFQKAYGFSLTDSKGKILDANGLLQRSADYWKSNATQGEKALVMSKLWSKNWTTLIPLFDLGGKGIAKYTAEQIHLTQAQAKSAAMFRVAQRDFQSGLDELITRAGLELLPELTGLFKGMSKGLDDNKAKIMDAFHGMVGAAKEIGGAITTYVIPGIKAIAGAWNSIPPDFRKLLITGVVANKALKVVFGFDPLKIVGGGIADIFKKGIGDFFGRGSPGNPMWTKEVGLPGVGGGGGVGALGGLSLAGIITAVTGGLLAAGAFKLLVQDPALNAQQAEALKNAQRQLGSNPTQRQLQIGIDGINQGIKDLKAIPGGEQLYSDQLAFLEKLRVMYETALKGQQISGPAATDKQKNAPRNERDKLTPVALHNAITQGNRSLPQRRDLTSGLLGITGAIRQMQGAIRGTEQAGFAAVVTAVYNMESAISGMAWNFGTAAAQGRGTGSGGRPTVARTPRVGIEKNRDSSRTLNLYVKASTSVRSNDSGSATQSRYGPTPSRAGAATLLVD
jgi:hypothetical protein